MLKMENVGGERRYNYGVAILRAAMCFLVVSCHFWDITGVASGIGNILFWLRGMPVPVFMFTSFLFCRPDSMMEDRRSIGRRFERLLIPQIGWACIYFVCFRVLCVIMHTEPQFSLGDLFWQMLWGHSEVLNATMWFQVVLLWITILFLILFSTIRNKRNAYCVLIALALVCIGMEYSSINFRLFQNLRFEMKYPLGRFVEMIPFAVMGTVAYRWNILDKLRPYWIQCSVTCILIILFALNFDVLPVAQGYGYQGLELCILCFALTTMFYVMPIKLRKGQRIFKKLTSYTLGIYCSHRLIGAIVYAVADYWGFSAYKGTLGLCCVIYLLSYLISMMGYALLKQTRLRALLN